MNFTLNFCEYNRQNPPHSQIYRPHGSGDYLFLLLKTPMRFCLNGETIITQPHACILYTPETPQNYTAVNRFLNSYLHFSCAENLAERFSLPQNAVFYPQNPEELDACISRLQEEYILGAPFAAEKEYHLVCELLISAARGLAHSTPGKNRRRPEDSELFLAFSRLRLEMLRHYERLWTTEQLCQRVGLEKSQFFACYRDFFQSSPHADLLQVRLDKAKNLLSNQALPIKQVAAQCGFTELSHFSRCFKKECGCAPSEYARRGFYN